MSEEPKNIRLNKAAKELNVGIPTLVEYLSKKGHHVEANPNARITPEQYDLLATAFQAERQVKENADRIEISTGNSVTIEASNTTPAEDASDFNDEIIIKNFNATNTKEKDNANEAPSNDVETNPTDEPQKDNVDKKGGRKKADEKTPADKKVKPEEVI